MKSLILKGRTKMKFEIIDFNDLKIPCEWCGGKVEIVKLPHPDKRVDIDLFKCKECNKVQTFDVVFHDNFPNDEAIKIRKELTEKYGA